MENDTEILFNASGGQVLDFEYWGNGRLAMARVVRPFGDALLNTNLSSLYERAETYASNLGINSTSYERIYRNSTERFGHVDIETGTWQGIPTTEVVLYSNYSGLPLAFGNELRITFDLELKQARELIIYPWFTAPSPNLSPSQASDIAVDFLNATRINRTSNLTYVDAYLAFDSYHYSLTYQVEVRYTFIDTTHHHLEEYRVWVDPYDGTVTYWVYVPKFIPPIPLTSSTNMWLLILVSFIVVVLAIMVAAFLLWTLRNGGRRKGKKSIKI